MKKITWKKGIERINFPTTELDPYKAIERVEKLNLPKYRKIGYEVIRYTGKDGFNCYPQVYIEK